MGVFACMGVCLSVWHGCEYYHALSGELGALGPLLQLVKERSPEVEESVPLRSLSFAL